MNKLQILNKLNELAFSYFNAQTLSAACRLEVFTHLAESPMDADSLARKTDIHPDGCERLLEALRVLGLVERENRQYRCSEVGLYMSEQASAPMRLIQSDNYFYRMWEYLPDALREFSPRFQQAWGVSAQEIYQSIYADPERLQQFMQLMDSYNVCIGEEIAKHVDFSLSKVLLDVAGGSGSLAAEIGRVHEHLSGYILDLPPVYEYSYQNSQVLDRFKPVVGDMYRSDTYPPDCDVILLSWILHNWSDDSCLKILANCHEVLPPGGMLLISEKVLDDERSGSWWGVMMSLQMLLACETGAKERTENEYRTLLSKAGFGDIFMVRLDAPRDIIVAYRQ
ncbi:MAG: hypothetical protein CME36_09350 [unclassified Hahellaceae]|nr:hypothetical protein [Hahellaceae bacterium]|tara:strand:+ start:15575 stop:16588 length:1014 start_codon:yes stop_codon:yes gene_type:complete